MQGGWQGSGSPVPGYWAKLYFILHQPFEAFPVFRFPSPVVVVIYPLLPWVGVMAAGYAFGALYQMDAPRRRRILLKMGSAATALFIILRIINLYGDPSYWSSQNSAIFTFLSFLNTTKYPPSLLFLLMTLGPAMFALAWFESNQIESAESEPGRQALRAKVRNVFITFGRVPLFFYLLQWPTAHFISVLLHLAAGKPTGWMFGGRIGSPAPAGSGFNLAVVYGCWIVGVVLLYSLCKWFAGVKQRRRNWWVSYL
ncbi:hypothetical protein BH18ACI4_BH18ACI4_12260 [soil metagenome]